jgi:hypothetical protein
MTPRLADDAPAPPAMMPRQVQQPPLPAAPASFRGRRRFARTARPGPAAISLALLLALAGCGRQRPPAAPAGPAPAARDAGKFKDVEVREDPVRTGIEAGDAGLAAQVRARLAGDPQLRRQHIEVDAEGGRVTLWGEAARAEDRTAAEQLARRTPGVTAVNDLVKVGPPPAAEPR